MLDPRKQSALAGQTAQGAAGFGERLHRDSTTGPLALLLSRLEHVKRYGKGYTARCPAHQDRTASLSLAEGTGDRVLLHCFACCPALEVVQAVGLNMADMYPERNAATTPKQRCEARVRARESDWTAALGILGFEARVLEVAAAEMIRCRPPAWADMRRVTLAAERIVAARERLTPAPRWRPEVRA